MRRSLACLCAVLTFAFVVPLYAGDRIGIGVKVGTLGFGADLTGRINNWFSVRGTFNTADVSGTLVEFVVRDGGQIARVTKDQE
jgi:hypothetical protein